MPVKRILIADDSATIRHFLIETLAKAGYEVSTVQTGEDAVRVSEEELPDLVIMDIVMPGMNGYQATRAINRNEATKHIPVLILTSKDMETDRIWAMRQGAKEFITKPIDPNTLIEKVRALA
ncbi:response regulator [Oxalobacteraceae bacterium R-40]|uniref:Response regulator n=1 Tax=Keguizhuia sedimenti TaxID=3064264 RepID=A0ABU1BJW5_9BURK|nr:response regulator [Oxalobacteraceae bacterium R-40]